MNIAKITIHKIIEPSWLPQTPEILYINGFEVCEFKKTLLIEALWNIIYSDKDADIYEANLMRRLSGLLYLDKKLVGDIKEKIKIKNCY